MLLTIKDMVEIHGDCEYVEFDGFDGIVFNKWIIGVVMPIEDKADGLLLTIMNPYVINDMKDAMILLNSQACGRISYTYDQLDGRLTKYEELL